VPLEDYRRFSPHFDSDVITRVSLQASVSGKNSIGGTGDVSMDQQLIRAREALGSTS